jgi:hypothetical protein
MSEFWFLGTNAYGLLDLQSEWWVALAVTLHLLVAFLCSSEDKARALLIPASVRKEFSDLSKSNAPKLGTSTET